jgi:hypothetical protein
MDLLKKNTEDSLTRNQKRIQQIADVQKLDRENTKK